MDFSPSPRAQQWQARLAVLLYVNLFPKTPPWNMSCMMAYFHRPLSKT